MQQLFLAVMPAILEVLRITLAQHCPLHAQIQFAQNFKKG